MEKVKGKEVRRREGERKGEEKEGNAARSQGIPCRGVA